MCDQETTVYSKKYKIAHREINFIMNVVNGKKKVQAYY